MKNIHISALIGGVIFVLCLYYLVFSFQWASIFQILYRVDLLWLIGSGVLSTVVFWLIRTLRFYFLLKALNVHIKFSHLYMINVLSMTFSIFTPVQTGEAIKIEMLRRSGGLDRAPGYAIFISERLIDLVVITLTAVLCFILGISKFIGNTTAIVSLCAIMILGIILYITIRYIPATSPLAPFSQAISQCLINWKVLFSVILLTILGWLVIALGWNGCLRSISIELSLPQSIAMTSIITVVNILSFIPSAVGISEIGIASFLMHLKYSAPLAQAGAIAIRIYALVVILLGLFHFIWMKFFTARSCPGTSHRSS